MLRTGLIISTLGVFFIAVGLGVNTSIKQFNQIVLPEQPLRLYDVVEEKPGVLQIELVGENFYINVAELKKQAATGQEFIYTQYHRQVASAVAMIKEQWQVLVQTEEVRAVNQWVKERI